MRDLPGEAGKTWGRWAQGSSGITVARFGDLVTLWKQWGFVLQVLRGVTSLHHSWSVESGKGERQEAHLEM